MKNKFFMIAAAFVTFLCLCSCSLVSDDSVSEVGSAEFTMSPELARAIVANQQNEDFNELYANEKESLLIEISLSGDYSDKKSLSIDLSDVHSEPKTEEEQNALAEKIMGQSIKFDSIPVGKTVKAEVTISLVTTFLADNIEDKRTLVKGSSEPVTIHEGNNSVTVQLDFIYKNFPFTFTLSVEKGSIDYSKCLGIYFYAIKSSSSIVDKLYTSFSSGDGTYSDFSNITSSLSDLPDFLGVASCFPNYNENYDSLKFTPLSEGKAECSGTIYLPADESVIFVVEAQFTSTTSSSGMISYLGHVSANNISDVRATAVTPVMPGNNVSLVLSKFALETQYALYQYQKSNSSSIPSTYQYYLSSSASETGMSEGTSVINTFSFDNDGHFYTLGNTTLKFYFSSDKADFGNHETDISYDNDLNEKPAISIDHKTNIMYLSTNAGVYDIYLEKYPNLISSASTESKAVYRYSKPSDSYLFVKGSPFAVYDDIAYFVVRNNDGTDYQLFKVDLSKGTWSDANSCYEIPESAGEMIDLGLSELNLSYSASISDMLYQNGAVYIITSEYNPGSTGMSAYSRGLIIKYDVSTETFTHIMEFAPTKTVTTFKSACSASTSIVYNSNNISDYYIHEFTCGSNPSELNFYTTFDNSNSYLVGPQKFIAIKPKKLVISDTGIAFYTTADGAISYKNVNRVVEIDLMTLSISKTTDVSLEFNTSTTYSSNNTSGLPVASGVVLTGKYKGSDLDLITATSGQIIVPFFAKDL